MVKRARYSAEFKAQAVRLVLEEGQHVREVANQLFLLPKTLAHWVQAAREGKVVPARRIDEKELELVSLRNEKQTITHGVRYPEKSRHCLHAFQLSSVTVLCVTGSFGKRFPRMDDTKTTANNRCA